MRSSVTASPSALLNRTVMNQSSTNVFGFEKYTAVFFVVTTTEPATSMGTTSYVSGRMSGFADAVATATGVGVGRYAGASTLQPNSTAETSAYARARRIGVEPSPAV